MLVTSKDIDKSCFQVSRLKKMSEAHS
jgi:hypothetical protein